MKVVVQAMLGLSMACAATVFAAAPVAAPALPAGAAVAGPAHIQAVQALLGAMHIEKALRGVAGRSRYASDAQRQAVFAKLDKVPAAEVYQRLAPALAPAISAATATEMTRFYTTPYGRQVIDKRYNSGAQIVMPGTRTVIAPAEAKERKRPAYVQATRALAEAEPAIDGALFKLLQQVNRENR